MFVKNASDTAKWLRKHDFMRLYEDIDTTRELEDVSKTKHKREAWRE